MRSIRCLAPVLLLAVVASCSRTPSAKKDADDATQRRLAAKAQLKQRGIDLDREGNTAANRLNGSDPAAIALFLDAGLSPSAVLTEEGVPLISVVAREGHRELLQRLLAAGVPADTQDDWLKMTPLMWAALRGRKEIVDMLLKAGASPNRQDKYGWTPLMFATANGDAPIVKRLLAAKADPAVATRTGWSAPMIARLRKKDAALALLEGTNAVAAAPKAKETVGDLEVAPGELAFRNVFPGERRALELTISLPANLSPHSIRLRTQQPFSIEPATIELAPGTSGTAILTFDAPTWLGDSTGLLDFGGGPRGSYGEMKIAAEVVPTVSVDPGKYQRITDFLARPGDRASREEYLGVILQQAVKVGDASQVEALLGAGIDPNVMKDYKTLLMISVDRGDAKTTSALLRGGADPHQNVGSAERPFKRARAQSSTSGVQEVMLDAGARY